MMMDKRDKPFLICCDGGSTLECIKDSFTAKERLNPGVGLIWGLIISLFLSLFLGAFISILL
jgi:hypothetical protein